ncbi:MAG: hypothetical protein AB8G23_24900 [Myxococcota bacterium]
MALMPAFDSDPEAADIGCTRWERFFAIGEDGEWKMGIAAAGGVSFRDLCSARALAVEDGESAVVECAAIACECGRINCERWASGEEELPERGGDEERKRKNEAKRVLQRVGSPPAPPAPPVSPKVFIVVSSSIGMICAIS